MAKTKEKTINIVKLSGRYYRNRGEILEAMRRKNPDLGEFIDGLSLEIA